jgi:C4-type Zn-finger protein
MSENFHLCPHCKKGEMRTHRRVVDGEANEPFLPKGRSNELICDMCGHYIDDTTVHERISVDDSVSAEVIKAKKSD